MFIKDFRRPLSPRTAGMICSHNRAVTDKNFEQFYALILSDIELQETLRTGAELDDLVLQIIRLGVAHGYEFTADDVIAKINKNKRIWIERWI